MCGIIGIVDHYKRAPRIADAALSALSKRGPDGHAAWNSPSCALGHTRLSIIDLAGGAQPMHHASGITIIFNGEIYNYQELRTELEAMGHRFATNSDTEVIIKAYLAFGHSCVERLDGMFAFAIWDSSKDELFLARDRFGKKPLYYSTRSDGMLIFGSEIKALRASGIAPVLDPAGLDAYLALMYVPPWRTIYANVQVVPPGHYAIYAKGSLHVTRYWMLTKASPLRIEYAEAKEEVRRLFTDAVRKRMVADVEVGSFLSGGVDSTLVSAYAQQFSSHPLKTFALGYGDAINELPFAEAAAQVIGSEHHPLQMSQDVIADLSRISAYFDEPHADSADIAQHLISELADSKVKVALSGDGGDELFMGYGWYWRHYNRPKLRQVRNALFSNPFKEHLRDITIFPQQMRDNLFLQPITARDPLDLLVRDTGETGIEAINLYDMTTYLPGQLLSKVDQMSMMHSLEVRSPLLDHHLAEFVYSLPREYKTDLHTGKLILKDLLREIMPDAFVDRKKQGFGAPVGIWLREEPVRAQVRSLFADAQCYGFLSKERVLDFIEKTFAGTNPAAYYQVWVLLCLELWLRNHPH